ncbi:putative pentatricopeptide repeat-containing protein [Nymphaea thermarum]|nr:putative pentatricopeptide repeat-containing protein [Nymphaea thermarum]
MQSGKTLAKRIQHQIHRHQLDAIGESRFSYLFLQACKDGNSIHQLHSLLHKTGLAAGSDFYRTKLVSLYGSLGEMKSARKMFDEKPQRNVYLWNAMLRSYCKEKLWDETLNLFWEMKRLGIETDNYTVPLALKACGGLSALKIAKQIHGSIVGTVMEGDMFVGAALIDVYSKCEAMENAYLVFTRYPQPDVVLWTSMVSGYQQNNGGKEAVEFFSRMLLAGISPDTITLISVLSACNQLGSIQGGRCCHCYIIRRGLDWNLSLSNALLHLYSKLGVIDVASRIFNRMQNRDVISWSSMIGGYVQNQQAKEALNAYKKMLNRGVEPNHVTVVSALQACAAASALEEGKRIHELTVRKGFEMETSVSTALLDMYMKCSHIDEALELFSRMPNKDVVAWAALISGYALNGLSDKSLGVFHNMLLANTLPDAVTIVKVLSSCAQSGNLQQALCLHGYLIRSGFDQKVFVGASLIDLYSKCGSLANAAEVFRHLEEKDVVAWSSIIAGYGIHGLALESFQLFEQMLQTGLKPNHITFISVLSACSHGGRVDEAWKLFNSMVHEHKVIPRAEHYACMVDVLGRTGQLDKALEFINNMPVEANSQVWGALLGACRIHGDIDLAELAASKLFHLDPNHRGYYVLLSNIYADGARWDGVANMRIIMKREKLTQVPGISSIEVGNNVYSFLAGDRLHQESKEIYNLVKRLGVMMKEEGYIPNGDYISSEGVEC